MVWLDALKGIGILSIMRIHMVHPMEWIQSLFYVGAVSMFFVASGITFKNPFHIYDAIKQKTRRLLLPYFFWSAVLLVIEHKMKTQNLTHDVLGVLYGRMRLLNTTSTDNTAFLTIGNAPMWFLPCMFLSYIWIYAFYCRCKTAISKISVMSAFILLSALLYFSPLMLPWSIDTSFLLAALIAIGYEKKELFIKPEARLLIVAFILWLPLFYFFAGSNISLGEYGAYGVISILPFLAIALTETYVISGFLHYLQDSWLARILAYIGRDSLRLMCIHLIIYIKVEDFLKTHFLELHDNKWFLIGISFSAIFAVNAIISYVLRLLKPRYAIAKYI